MTNAELIRASRCYQLPAVKDELLGELGDGLEAAEKRVELLEDKLVELGGVGALPTEGEVPLWARRIAALEKRIAELEAGEVEAVCRMNGKRTCHWTTYDCEEPCPYCRGTGKIKARRAK